jgi:heme a synthase
MARGKLYYLVTAATCIAFVVIILGAYTRLSDAGLGCPDWPGCYGNLIAPTSANSVAEINQSYPYVTVHSAKAWTEMIHRYFAGTLGLFILIIAVLSIFHRQKIYHPNSLPIVLVALVIFQAILGMWTVTWQLIPWVVLGHLIGGLLILSCLWWLMIQLSQNSQQNLSISNKSLLPWIRLGALIVFIQIALGGWVSTNYAGLACIGFPFCNGQLVPAFDLSQAFSIHHAIGINYEGGVLSNSGRITIQLVHRLGALITFIYLSALSLWLLFNKYPRKLRLKAVTILILLVIQLSLGIINVTSLLPLWAAVAHNGIAMLLFLALLALLYQSKYEPKGLK